MHMPEFLKNRWVLLLGLIVFVAFKVPHLSYPYYWDESWPYATAIRAMAQHGISLMPDAVDGELSRGHPLFFHALGASWAKVFGAGHVSMHSMALFISVLFLICIYEAALRMFNVRVAVMAFLLVASQEVFFMQSSYVLFEMLIAFLCFISMWAWVKERYVLAALFMTMLFYTKESGLIMGFVLGLDALASLFRKDTDKATALKRIAAVGVPCVLIGVFFLLQKHIRGWYIFPFYSEIIERSWNTIWYKLRMNCMGDAFYRNQKYWYYLLLLALGAIAAVKERKWRYLAIAVPVIMVFYMVDDKRAGRIMPSIPFALLFVAGWFFTIWVFSSKTLFEKAYQRRFIALAGCFMLCFLWFSTMNYYTYRYLLAVIVPAFFIMAVLFDVFLRSGYKQAVYVLFPAFAVISYSAWSMNDHFGDTDRGALIAMDVQQNIVDYLEEHNCYEKHISVTSYVESQHLADPGTGFLKSARRFPHVQWDIDGNTDYVIFDNIESDYRYDQIRNDTSFVRVHRYERGNIWTELYARKR